MRKISGEAEVGGVMLIVMDLMVISHLLGTMAVQP
jgi:hypothetical protein